MEKYITVHVFPSLLRPTPWRCEQRRPCASSARHQLTPRHGGEHARDAVGWHVFIVNVPHVTWYKDRVQFEATKRHYFSTDDQLLIIVQTRVSDAATYTCQMVNSLGRKQAGTYLKDNLAGDSGRRTYAEDNPRRTSHIHQQKTEVTWLNTSALTRQNFTSQMNYRTSAWSSSEHLWY